MGKRERERDIYIAPLFRKRECDQRLDLYFNLMYIYIYTLYVIYIFTHKREETTLVVVRE